jgi:RNA polymerase sigma-70 factor (ECF subfamily)
MDVEPQSPRDDDRTPVSLLDQLRHNTPGAWERVLDLYRPLVAFWCRRAGLRGADLEDITQEVFAAAVAGFSTFRHDRPGDTFRGWLRGITRNKVLLLRRRSQSQPQAEGGSAAKQRLEEFLDPLGAEDAEEHCEVHAVALRGMEQVRGQFEPQTWTAFWKTVVEAIAPAEVAAELGVSPAAIRQAKSRVLRRLRDELGDLVGP